MPRNTIIYFSDFGITPLPLRPKKETGYWLPDTVTGQQ